MPVKRTQIRGIKDAKKSDKNSKTVKIKKPIINEGNEEKMQSKAAKKYCKGGKLK